LNWDKEVEDDAGMGVGNALI